MSYFDDVGDFHKKFGLPHFPTTEPNLLDTDDLDFRVDFMREELREFQSACDHEDLSGAADALCDLVYVALGTAHLMGLSFGEHWLEVQRANMTKERATDADDPRSTRHHHLDVVKPASFIGPNHDDIIQRTRAKP